MKDLHLGTFIVRIGADWVYVGSIGTDLSKINKFMAGFFLPKRVLNALQRFLIFPCVGEGTTTTTVADVCCCALVWWVELHFKENKKKINFFLCQSCIKHVGRKTIWK